MNEGIRLQADLNLSLPPVQKTGRTSQFSKKYPNIAGWVQDGWIEIGRDGYSTYLIRGCDEGGTVWEGGTRHKSMDKILQEAETAIAKWMGENG